MAFPVRTTLSSLLKFAVHRNFHRCLSSKKYFLPEGLRVRPTAQEDVFVQPSEELTLLPTRTFLFGGTLIGTSINAAQKTVPPTQAIHSAHCYYVSSADASSPIFYHVTRIRDGKSFATRSVAAKQNDRIVFQASMSFHQHEKGKLAHATALEDTGELDYLDGSKERRVSFFLSRYSSTRRSPFR